MKRRTSSYMVGNYRDWSEFIESLNQQRVRFIVVGAHALAALGRPRNTGDLDIFVDPTPENASRLRAALKTFGFNVTDEILKLSKPGKMITLGREPVRIDVTTEMTGLTFAEAWQGRFTRKVGGSTINFLGREEYIKNKIETAARMPNRRAGDLRDVEMLKRGKRRKRQK